MFPFEVLKQRKLVFELQRKKKKDSVKTKINTFSMKMYLPDVVCSALYENDTYLGRGPFSRNRKIRSGSKQSGIEVVIRITNVHNVKLLEALHY